MKWIFGIVLALGVSFGTVLGSLIIAAILEHPDRKPPTPRR